MRVLVTGSRGLIGSALVGALRARGDEVVQLVRSAPAGLDEVGWDPKSGTLDPAALFGVTAVVNLAGAGVGDHRWTPAYRREIRDSRVLGTATLARALAGMAQPPEVLVSASAIGYYGDTGDRSVDESAPPGSGFLAEVVRDWEAAADPARAAGIRVAHPRTGLVVARHGGAWARLFPIFSLGLGGRLGSGRQYWSFISLRDEVSGLLRLLDDPGISGPVNLTAPTPVTNAEVTRAMGEVLHRPTPFPVPAAALRLVLGDFSQEVLGSLRVLPTRLTAAGFQWADADIRSAIRSA